MSLKVHEIKDNWKIETKGNKEILAFNHVIYNPPKNMQLRTKRL